jgi:SAM-dependent methyltransferase
MTDTSHAAPKFLTDLFGWYSMTMLGLGSRTGLLAALGQRAGTVEEIAVRAGVDRRNCLEWLRALAAAGHVSEANGVFSLSPETTMVLGPGFPVDARAIVEFVSGTPAVIDQVAQAISTGTGVEPAIFQEAYGEAVARVNAPTYRAALVTEWIAGVPGLADKLSAGGRVADLACGNGTAAVLIATAFPLSHVVGYDLDAGVIDQAGLPANVELRAADVRALPRGEQFDLVICLDSLHHFGDAEVITHQVHQVLEPSGVFLIAESGLTGDLATDCTNPFAAIVYSAGLLYCLQENLAAGGLGHTAADGPSWVTDALAIAGFTDITVTPSETGYNIITGRAAANPFDRVD